MKKIFMAVMAVLLFTSFSACDVLAQVTSGKGDTMIPYEFLGTDAAFKQFKKASKNNQTEILNHLLYEAENAFLKCESLDDLYKVKENLEEINFYYENAKQTSISVARSIRSLNRRIIDIEREFKDLTPRVDETRTTFKDRGFDAE